MSKLTNKQKTFVEEYLVDLNATQAAKRAGYSKKTAKQMGTENLSKPVIQEAIAIAMDARSRRTEITADRVLQELAKLGFSNIQGIFTEAEQLKAISALPEEIAASIQSIEVVVRPTYEEDDEGNKIVEHIHKIKLADKRGPLELLGKHLVLFSDKIIHDGAIPVTEVKRTIVDPKPANS